MKNYRGIRGIGLVRHGAWADPELKYKNRLFNCWDIEEAIFEDFKDWANEYGIKVNSENEDTLFDEYCKNDNGAAVKNYLDDYIFAGGGCVSMTKREYCKKNPGVAALATSAFGGYVVHGVEYDIDDRVYITYQIDDKILSYHKLLIRYNAHGAAYVLINGNRFYLNDFLRLEVTR